MCNLNYVFNLPPFQLPPTLASSEGIMGNKQSHSEADDNVAEATALRGRIAATSAAASSAVEDAEEPVEVPPPMQPISSVPLSTAVDDSKKVGMNIKHKT